MPSLGSAASARIRGGRWTGFYLGPVEWRTRCKLPPDTFFAAGILGQRIVIIPSRRLVIATFCLSHGSIPDDIQQPLGQLAVDVIAAPATDLGATVRSELWN